MKSFFDFIGRTEATRGARRWSWTILEVNFILSYLVKKAEVPFSPFRISHEVHRELHDS
ncbi:hypothetical protein M3204_04965 [Mesobacillus subterraneus]|jgi:hypothetical protein|uniref:hypothetical protein n=1 Tax=Mesobacillus subterraneus TaxID=285983 RepID=UPI00203CBE8D|nr:hypothetical protein [Mesobacillus subterraneus]MCM3663742.1 hypothetical protein [Mesobacillus subterraneus]MCM3683504.1 hypothetical protein [Mesobacillus subterraneus]